jgi:hypothetical protein
MTKCSRPCIGVWRGSERGLVRRLRAIAIDCWKAAQLAWQLEGDGYETVGFGSGYTSMNSPTKKLEQIVLSGQLAHGGTQLSRSRPEPIAAASKCSARRSNVAR